MKGVQVMATINLQCNSLCQIHSSGYFSSMTGRAYMGEVLTQVWLKSIKKCVSYLTNKVNVQKRV